MRIGRFAALLGLTLALWSAAAPAGAQDVYGEITRKGLVTHAYDAFLRDFLDAAVARGDLSHDFNVGGAFDRAKINIFVLSADVENRRQDIESIDIRYFAALRNFLAVGPATILVGEEIFADLILNITNDVGYILQAGQLSDDPATGLNTAGSLATFLRLGNIRNSRTYENPDHHPRTLAPMIIESMNEVFGGTFPDLYYYGLLFIFSHEVAHLERHRGGGLVDAAEIVKRWRRDATLAEERRADEVARRVIAQSAARTGNPNDWLSLISVASYLRDTINIEVFDDLRPVDASELFVTFLHRDCDPEAARLRDLRTDNIDLVVGGYWNVLPVLSGAEYARVRQMFVSQKEIATHEHDFLRVGDIVEDLERLGLDPSALSPINPFIRFYEAVLKGGAYIRKGDIVGTTAFSEDEILSFLGTAASLESSPVCAEGLICKVGTFEQDGIVEIVSDGGQVKYAVFYFPVKWANISDSGLSEAEAEAYIRNLAVMMRLYANLRRLKSVSADGDVPEAEQEQLMEVAAMRGQILQCGYYTNVFLERDDTLEISTLRAGAWIRFKIFPNAHDILVLN